MLQVCAKKKLKEIAGEKTCSLAGYIKSKDGTIKKEEQKGYYSNGMRTWKKLFYDNRGKNIQ